MSDRDFEMFACFQDGMILQRESDVKIWGFAQKGTKLCLRFEAAAQEAVTQETVAQGAVLRESVMYETEADDSGEFVFEIKTGSAGGPYSMEISSKECSQKINDIMLGDVYLASGQSNMEFTVENTIDLIGKRIDDIDYPMIREFRVPEQIRFDGYDRQFNGGSWLKASVKDELLKMSAVAFHFAEQIHISEGIPIGIINNSIGGTPIEAHLPKEVLAKYKDYDDEIKRCCDSEYVKKVQEDELRRQDEWYALLDEKDVGMKGAGMKGASMKDAGMKGAGMKDACMADGEPLYAACDYDDADWSDMVIPGTFYHTELEGFHGSVWFRKQFEIPDDFLLDDVMLRLGALVDADKVYLNGSLVGETDYMYPPRRYPLRNGILRHGKNVLAVRLIINRGTGGFIKDKKYCLQGREYIYDGSYAGDAHMPEDADVSHGRWEYDLSGEWKYAIGTDMEELPNMTFFQYKPTGLYNSMMKPLERYSFTGGLWYQGESNTAEPKKYALLIKDLITCWRSWFGKNLPFFYVQLPQFADPASGGMRDEWYVFREVQRQVLRLPRTAMAVTIDIGESNDLHPQDKETLGKRLALAALNMIYGKYVEYSGPVVKHAYEDAGSHTVNVKFSHCGAGIKLVNDNYEYFEVRDNMGTWRKVTGYRVSGNEIVLDCPEGNASSYRGVRYAWFNDPCSPPVYNASGLPASPFMVTWPEWWE